MNLIIALITRVIKYARQRHLNETEHHLKIFLQHVYLQARIITGARQRSELYSLPACAPIMLNLNWATSHFSRIETIRCVCIGQILECLTDVKITIPNRERSCICGHHRVQESRLIKTLYYILRDQEQIVLC